MRAVGNACTISAAYRTAPSPVNTCGADDRNPSRIAVGGPARGVSSADTRSGSSSAASVTRNAALNTSRRCASIQDTTGVPGSLARAAWASASSADTATTRFPQVNASPWIVAMPMRMPVNDPGPDATAKTSTSRNVSACASSSATSSPGSRSAWLRDPSPRRTSTMRSSSTIAALPSRVVVSRERIRTFLD